MIEEIDIHQFSIENFEEINKLYKKVNTSLNGEDVRTVFIVLLKTIYGLLETQSERLSYDQIIRLFQEARTIMNINIDILEKDITNKKTRLN